MSRTQRRIGDTTPTAKERDDARGFYREVLKGNHAGMVGYLHSAFDTIANPGVSDDGATRAIARARALLDASDEQWNEED
jgi:hypothetical protein